MVKPGSFAIRLQRLRLWHGALIICLVCCTGMAPAAPPEQPVTCNEVSWSALSFEAHKLLLSATTELTVEKLPTPELASELREVPANQGVAVPATSGCLVKLALETRLPFGRREVASAWIDQASGQALQGEKLVSGNKAYWKLWRYTDQGYVEWRAEPTREQRDQATARWTRRKVTVERYDPQPAAGIAVSDPYALLYLVAAAHLEVVGAELRLVVPSRDGLVELHFRTEEKITRELCHEEISPQGTVRRTGRVPVWKVVGTGRYLGSTEVSDDVDTGFMGMRGGLTILIEQGTGIPVEISGRTKVLGRITVNLVSVQRR